MAVGTRRRFAALSSMVVTATLATSLMVSSVAGAAGPMTGRLFDPITYATVGGVTVTAEATDGSGSFTGSSAADGTFSVQVGDAQYLVGIDGAAAGYGSGLAAVRLRRAEPGDRRRQVGGHPVHRRGSSVTSSSPSRSTRASW